MNPLNPWVALTEILLLLGASFGLGLGMAWLQVRKGLQARKRAIQNVQNELKKTA